LSLSLSTGTLFFSIVVASVESAVIVLDRVSVLVGPSIEIVGVADDPLAVAAVLSSAFPVVLLDLGDWGEGDCPTVADD
jgi:repressor of nif and glnA expression